MIIYKKASAFLWYNEYVMCMQNILLIEDNEYIIKGLVHSLNQVELDVIVCQNKQDIIDIKFNDYDLILLDVTLPDLNGFDLCKEIKSNYQVPVIFLTAKDEEEDIVLGFELGCDDYVTKPFKTRELIARIRRIINKDNKYIKCQNVKIELDSKKVYVDDSIIELTALEYKILLLLFMNMNKVVTRQYILTNIWDYSDNFVNDNTLTVYIKRIRTKLHNDTLIKTIKGIGYRVDN